MLSGKQKRHLRALGHSLKPVIQVGKKEIDAALLAETGVALESHELIKVKLLESCLLEKGEAAEIMARECRAEVAQILGRTILLYRPAKEPVIKLPKADKPAKTTVP